MSFAFLPLYTGDYIRDTQHLSLLEHGAFLKLLMYCWDQKGPAPHDERRLMGICNARSKEEITAVYGILEEYFVRMDDGWHNVRLTKELQKSEAISQNRAEAGRLGGIARAAKQMLGKCQASVKHLPVTPTPTPISTPTKEKTKTHTRFAAREYLSSRGLSDQTITDYLAIRKDKKLTPTLKAMERIEKEAQKAGMTFAEAIETCCANSWAGFNADWCKQAGSIDYSKLGD